MTVDAVIFIIFAVVAIIGATMMISLRNPVLSVMSLIVSLVAQAVLYLQLGALFVGAVLVIIYSGAILVLFLFVIMLLNLRGNEDLGKSSPLLHQIIKYGLSFLIFVEMVFIIRAGFADNTALFMDNLSNQPENFGSVEQVAEKLFTVYLYPFELTSILLLSAIVGAVVLSKKANDYEDIDEEIDEYKDEVE